MTSSSELSIEKTMSISTTTTTTATTILNDSINTSLDKIYNTDDLSSSTTSITESDESSNVQVFVLTAIFVAIVIGNVPIVITIIFGKLGKTRMYYFLLHLCIADLITGFFNVIPQIIWEITRTFHGGNILCKSIKYLQILGLYLSSFTLTAMSIDRFLAICHPLTNNHLSLYRAKRSLTIAWSLSIIFCLPQLYIFSYTNLEDGTMECWGSFPYPPWGIRLYVTWYAVSSFIIPFSIIFYTNFRICCELWKNSRERRLTATAKISTKRINNKSNNNIHGKRIFRFASPKTSNNMCRHDNVIINSSQQLTQQNNSTASVISVDNVTTDHDTDGDGNNLTFTHHQTSVRPSTLFNCDDSIQSTSSDINGDNNIDKSPSKSFECTVNRSTSSQITQSNCNWQPVSILSKKKCKQTTASSPSLRMSEINKSFNETGDTIPPGGDGGDGRDGEITVSTVNQDKSSSKKSSRVYTFFTNRKSHVNKASKCHQLNESLDKVKCHVTSDTGSSKDNDFILPSSPSQTEFRVHRGGYNAGTSRSLTHSKKVSMSSVDFVHNDTTVSTQVDSLHCNRRQETLNVQCDVIDDRQHKHNHHGKLSFLSFLNPLSSDNHSANRHETSTSSSCYNSPSMLRFNRCISQEDEHLRAKIKSVKLTVTVILCYVVCSLPFIFVQLWAHWYPGAQESASWTGKYFNGLFLLLLLYDRISSLERRHT